MTGRTSRDVATAARRAAALHTHWQRDDIPGLQAVMGEVECWREWVDLTLALLDVSARTGGLGEGLEGVLLNAALRENDIEGDGHA